MFRYDKRCDRCDGKFGNFVGTEHTRSIKKSGFAAASVVGGVMNGIKASDGKQLPKYTHLQAVGSLGSVIS